MRSLSASVPQSGRARVLCWVERTPGVTRRWVERESALALGQVLHALLFLAAPLYACQAFRAFIPDAELPTLASGSRLRERRAHAA